MSSADSKMATAPTAKYVTIDDGLSYSVDNFCVLSCYKDYLDSVLVPEGLIKDRVWRLAEEINTKIGDGPISALCVLKGSYRFFTDLTKALSIFRAQCHFPITVDFIQLRSYCDTGSTGNVEVIGGNPLSSLKGQHVLVVEDVVDTGLTMQRLLTLLKDHQPASVNVACLFRKRRKDSTYWSDFTGFSIPDYFVVGYGLDYNQMFRDLNHLCVINKKGKEKYKTKT